MKLALVIVPGALAVLAALSIAGCGRTDPGPAPAWNSATLQMPPGVPARDLPDPGSRGAERVVRYCSGCHGIPSPASHAPEDWGPTVRRMVLRMERLSGMRGMMGGSGTPMMSGSVAVPSPEEQAEILSYLRAHAMRSIDPARVREASSPAAGEFARACSRCHALPDPEQHTAAQWPAVVQRMRGNMRKMHVSGIADAEAHDITAYLERSAGGGPGR